MKKIILLVVSIIIILVAILIIASLTHYTLGQQDYNPEVLPGTGIHVNDLGNQNPDDLIKDYTNKRGYKELDKRK